MDPLRNPFRPGAGTPPPALIGRDGLIDAFGVTIRRARTGRPGKSLMPIGLRGVGKTVLLNRFARIATDEGFGVVFIEAPETGSFPALLVARLRRALLDMDRTAGKKAKEAILRALGVLKAFNLQLADGSSVRLDVEAISGEADSGVLAEDITDLLVAIGEAAARAAAGLLIAIDEVQYLKAPEFAGLITAVHRTSQLDLPVVLVGAGLPQLPGLAGDAKSYAERLFEFPQVGSLSAVEARAVIAVPAEDEGVTFAPAALDRIVAEAQGYPYFLQEWGYSVWNLAATEFVSEDDVLAASATVVDQLDRNFFFVRFDRLTPKEKEYLRAMAAMGPGPHRSGDIAAELRMRVESVAPRRSKLIVKGMVYSPAHGDTAFTVPLFDDFLKRAMPDWPPSG